MKKGYISAFQLGALSAIRSLFEIAEGKTGQPGCDMDAVFYSAAFQGGFDRFVMPDIKSEREHISDFVISRTDLLKSSHGDKFDIFHDVFVNHFGDTFFSDDNLLPVRNIAILLDELFASMGTGSSIVRGWGMPDRNELKTLEKLLPSHLFVPINTLLSCVQQETALLPVTTSTYQREDIKRLQDIFESNNFHRYSDIHAALDDQDQDASKAIANVSFAGSALQNTYGNLLTLMRSGVGLLSLTPKIVDAACGKLPGAVADTAMKLGMNFVEERRRIVIYSYDNLIMDVMIKNLHRMFVKPDTKIETKDHI